MGRLAALVLFAASPLLLGASPASAQAQRFHVHVGGRAIASTGARRGSAT